MNEQRSLISNRWQKVKPPRPREIAIHATVWALYVRCGTPGTFGCHIPNGEKRSVRTGRKLKRMGQVNGVADLLFLKKDPAGGRPFIYWLELKRPGETFRPGPFGELSDQEIFRDKMLALGCEHAVADNVAEAERIMVSWGLLRMSPSEALS